MDDSRGFCLFSCRNLDALTSICATLDTHRSLQILHPAFLVDANGEHQLTVCPITPC